LAPAGSDWSAVDAWFDESAATPAELPAGEIAPGPTSISGQPRPRFRGARQRERL